jgi:hypothetical protein
VSVAFCSAERRPPWGSKLKATRARSASALGYLGPTPEIGVSTFLIMPLRR